MTQQIFLDPEEVANLEPSEGDERHRIWLSPFAVPRAVSAQHDAVANSFQIGFEYAAQESSGLPELLDEPKGEPPVLVRLGIHTQKVVEVKVAPFDGPSNLTRLATRFRQAAAKAQSPARRLSYLMTAAILDFAKARLADEPG